MKIEIDIDEKYSDIAVERKTFVYTKDESYEIDLRLYEVEQQLIDQGFIRISKTTMALFATVFSWFPVGNIRAWIGFLICFIFSTAISVGINKLEENAEGMLKQSSLIGDKQIERDGYKNEM